MRRSLTVLIATFLFTSAGVGYAKTTYYCAPADQIIFTAQKGPWPYLYTALTTMVNQGIQPALTGWGFANKAMNNRSAEWTDDALACNYDGQTDQSQSEPMTLLSEPLGDMVRCNFPTNAGKLFCNSPDPYACPMVCD